MITLSKISFGRECFSQMCLILAKCNHQFLVQNRVLHFFYSSSFPVVPKHSFFLISFLKFLIFLNSKSLLVICFKYSSVYVRVNLNLSILCLPRILEQKPFNAWKLNFILDGFGDRCSLCGISHGAHHAEHGTWCFSQYSV